MDIVRCPLPHPCGHSFWSKEQRKAEKGVAVIQQNHSSKLRNENFDYTDLNSMQLTRGCTVQDNQKEMYQTKNIKVKNTLHFKASFQCLEVFDTMHNGTLQGTQRKCI